MINRLAWLALALTITGCTMSETGGTKPDVAGNRWATTAPPNPITEPLGAKKDVGYALNEKPASAHFNWMLRQNGLIDNWLAANIVREFSGLSEAIAATTTPEIFRIGQPAAGNTAPGSDAFTALTPVEITGNVVDIRTDGSRIYISDDAGNLIAIDPETGATLWAIVPFQAMAPMAVTGDYIYLGVSTLVGMQERNTSDGSTNQTISSGAAGASKIVANGEYAVVIDFATTGAYYYSGLGATLAYDGSQTTVGNYIFRDVAIDQENVYFLNYDTVADISSVSCYDLATRSLQWSYNNPTGTATKNINSIATDGEFIYLACDSAALDGSVAWATGETYNAFVLDKAGKYAAYANIGSLGDLDIVATDGNLLYYTDSAGLAHVSTLRGMTMGYLWTQGTMDIHDVDGVSSVGLDGSNQIVRKMSADQPVTFQRTDGDDPNRRPFFNLAIPLR